MLLAMGYVNTRWEMPPADASDYEEGSLKGKGTFGTMALVRNPASDTLGDAAKATSIFVQTLKTDRKSNILGGAAPTCEVIGNEVGNLGRMVWRGGR